MRRVFWMAVGAGAAVWTMNKVNEVARSLTPGGLADTAARGAVSASDAVRAFTADVRTTMVRRELELNRQLGLDGSVLATPGDPERPVLRGSAARPALESRAAHDQAHDHDSDRTTRYEQKEGH